MSEIPQEQPSPVAVADKPVEEDKVVQEAFGARAEALNSMQETREKLGGGVVVDERGMVVSAESAKKEEELRKENNGAPLDETATKI